MTWDVAVFLLIFASATSAGATPGAREYSTPADACAAADVVLRGVLDDWPKESPRLDDRAPTAALQKDYLEGGRWYGVAPSRELALAFEAEVRKSPVADCPNLIDTVTARGGRLGTTEISGLGRDSEGRPTAVMSVRMTLPIVQGDDALMLWEQREGPLAAEGDVVHLRRDSKGLWRKVGTLILWQS